jgi:3-methyladenine DNA glycosylase Tag
MWVILLKRKKYYDAFGEYDLEKPLTTAKIIAV